jgi:hypothetical protein
MQPGFNGKKSHAIQTKLTIFHGKNSVSIFSTVKGRQRTCKAQEQAKPD